MEEKKQPEEAPDYARKATELSFRMCYLFRKRFPQGWELENNLNFLPDYDHIPRDGWEAADSWPHIDNFLLSPNFPGYWYTLTFNEIAEYVFWISPNLIERFTAIIDANAKEDIGRVIYKDSFGSFDYESLYLRICNLSIKTFDAKLWEDIQLNDPLYLQYIEELRILFNIPKGYMEYYYNVPPRTKTPPFIFKVKKYFMMVDSFLQQKAKLEKLYPSLMEPTPEEPTAATAEEPTPEERKPKRNRKPKNYMENIAWGGDAKKNPEHAVEVIKGIMKEEKLRAKKAAEVLVAAKRAGWFISFPGFVAYENIFTDTNKESRYRIGYIDSKSYQKFITHPEKAVKERWTDRKKEEMRRKRLFYEWEGTDLTRIENKLKNRIATYN